MIILYNGKGSRDFRLLEPALNENETKNLLLHVQQILVKRGEAEAASFLSNMNFRLSNGTNDFKDKFSVLHAPVSLEEYEYFRGLIEDAKDFNTLMQATRPFELIASTVTELGIFVRFVTCQVDLSRPPAISSNVSNQALFTFSDNEKIAYKGLNFRSKTEIKIFEALIKRSLLVLPLPVAVMGEMEKYREPDFVVFYKGKVGIIEIHGDKWHPPETAASEHERRRAFTKLGVHIYEIFGADRCWNEPDKVIDDFLREFVR